MKKSYLFSVIYGSNILGLFMKVGKKDMHMFQVHAPVNNGTECEKRSSARIYEIHYKIRIGVL
jgi:hypothetical protein